ncbi:GNAT family N-acetyltransferase [Novosphingobium beihaiensis]|uniref:GNAT family N-acetyltransferase n=1 Tax=Novosphingobium beihaiensis TaxID=2930389 RepID=A0ABT0BUA2_9SPHN|nr:GNAT family N-acetyltransferase [Novosphingobium beihaiensis]MCJ2188629.1 GNAT family N-acetyltransferase [Novosphingobium beihaiensis]
MDRRPVLEGDRLMLRPLIPADWDTLYAIARDPQIWAQHPSHDRWQEPVFRQFFADAFVRGGALAIVDKAGGEVIGSSQFGPEEAENPGEIEIGWSFLARAFWGKGYNAEFKRLMLAHALAHYDRAIFQVGEDNAISRRAMENIGGVLTDRTRVFERAGKIVRHVIYEITREGFKSGPLG